MSVYFDEISKLADTMIGKGYRATGTDDNYGQPLLVNDNCPDAGEFTYTAPIFLADAGIAPWWEVASYENGDSIPADCQRAIHLLDVICNKTLPDYELDLERFELID
jgi:hypothetical protein